LKKRNSEKQRMRPRLSVVSLALVLVVISSYSYVSGAGTNHVSEKEAILKVVEQYVEAYNQPGQLRAALT
jgi:hypothetical protein